MTMLEKMARAIAERRKDYGYEATGKLDPAFVADARVALLAIRDGAAGFDEAIDRAHTNAGCMMYEGASGEAIVEAIIDAITDPDTPPAP